MEFSTKLNPEHSLRMIRGIKGTRQKVMIMHNPSEIDQNQLLLVRFLNLGSDDVIIPELSLKAGDRRTLVSNIGKAIVKKLAVKFGGNEILGVADFDLFACYQDLWKTESEKQNGVRKGIINSSGCTLSCMKLQINAVDKDAWRVQDVAIDSGTGNV